jgi:crotonobetainyl-CoA:carnitine CoA-transferase CaiB-like acyl-CoA transferase
MILADMGAEVVRLERPGKGFDLIAQGMGGIMHVTGEPDGPPISVRLPICDLGTGMWAVQGHSQMRPLPAMRRVASSDGPF